MSVRAVRTFQMDGLQPAGRLVLQGYPLTDGLSELLPWPRLRPGAVVAVTSRVPVGMTSLIFTILAGPSQAGAWCAVVGAPGVSAAAASRVGICLSRLALVPDVAGRENQVTGVLLEGMDVVALRSRGPVRPADAARLAARARNRGSVLVPFGAGAAQWPGAAARLTVSRLRWHGLKEGRGLLRYCSVTVSSAVKGRRRDITMWPYGRPEIEADGIGRLAPVISLADRQSARKGGDTSADPGRAVS